MNISQENQLIDQIIQRALSEDLGTIGDVTSNAIFSDSDQATAIIKSKSEGVLSGSYLLKQLFTSINKDMKVELKAADGTKLQAGTVICSLDGPVKAILAGERVALNFLQRLSGIATMSANLSKAIAHTSTRLLDTRKTTPTLRLLEKRAVVHGGGCNHRFGLFDMILIKDTHVKRSGSVTNALNNALAFKRNNPQLKIEVEVQSVAEFHEAVVCKPDRIMLDNMSKQDMTKCVQYLKENNIQIETEASGNITLVTIADIAQTGVDFISSGAITHSAPALDIHLVIT